MKHSQSKPTPSTQTKSTIIQPTQPTQPISNTQIPIPSQPIIKTQNQTLQNPNSPPQLSQLNLPFNTPYSIRVNPKPVLTCLDGSKTKQSFKDEVNINSIIRRFQSTGELPLDGPSNPKYADVSNLPSYQDSLNYVNYAQEQFNSLSSEIRERFDNNPGKYLEFVSDPKNVQELIKLGLAIAKPKAEKPAETPKPTEKQA